MRALRALQTAQGESIEKALTDLVEVEIAERQLGPRIRARDFHVGVAFRVLRDSFKLLGVEPFDQG